MAFRTPLQATIACLKADANVAAIVGVKVLGTIALQTPPPYVVVQLPRSGFDFRTGTDTQKTRLDALYLTVECVANTSDLADTLGAYVKEILDDLGSNAVFDVANAVLTLSNLRDYFVRFSPERAPDAQPVFVATVKHELALTTTKPRP